MLREDFDDPTTRRDRIKAAIGVPIAVESDHCFLPRDFSGEPHPGIPLDLINRVIGEAVTSRLAEDFFTSSPLLTYFRSSR